MHTKDHKTMSRQDGGSPCGAGARARVGSDRNVASLSRAALSENDRDALGVRKARVSANVGKMPSRRQGGRDGRHSRHARCKNDRVAVLGVFRHGAVNRHRAAFEGKGVCRGKHAGRSAEGD